MNWLDVLHLLPLLIMACTILLALLTLCVFRSHRVIAGLTSLGFLATLIAAIFGGQMESGSVTLLLKMDHFTMLFIGLFASTGVILTFLAYDYWKKQTGQPEEFYVLLLLASLGAMTLVSAEHFVSLFLGLETLSVSLYALMAYRRTDPLGIEAGVKYLILAATASAILLFGMALIYAEYGTMRLPELTLGHGLLGQLTPLSAAGLALLIAGLCFKMALVPFHLWTPDIYQGSPTPSAAFVATVSKGSVLAIMLRYFGPGSCVEELLQPFYFVVAMASMFIGNLLALQQTNLKRILAYSSIAHMGYLIMTLATDGSEVAISMVFYLITYFSAIIGAFGVMAYLSDEKEDIQPLENIRALAWSRPGPAAVLTVAMFSLAGIPITAGFLGKVYILTTGVATSSWWLTFGLVISSTIGLYYYLRVIVSVYLHPSEDLDLLVSTHGPAISISTWPIVGTITLWVTTLILFWIGIYPAPILHLVELCCAGVP